MKKTQLIVVFLLASFCLSTHIETVFSVVPKEILLDRPVGPGVDSHTCQGLWFKTGYICNIEKTKQFALDDKAELEGEVRRFDQVLDDLETLLQANALKLESANQLREVINGQNKIKMKQNARRCWDKMAEVRSNSLCSICSGQNAQFFFRNKSLVDLPLCRAVLAVCSDHFEELLKIKKVSEVVMQIFRRFSNSKSNQVHLQALSRHRFYNLVMYRRYGWGSADKLDADLCESALRIRAPPIVGEYTKVYSAFISEPVRLVKQRSNRMLRMESTSRTLDGGSLFGANNNNLLDGDILVLKKEDNIFTAVDGFKGTFQDISHGHFKPMNLSLRFL